MRTATTRTQRLISASLGCLLALVMIVGAGCGKKESPTPSSGTPESNSTPGLQTPVPNDVPEPAAEPNAIAATVNGEIITEAQLNERIDYYLRMDPQASRLPSQLISQLRPTLRPRILDVLVGQVLLKQEARAAGMEVSEDEALATLEQTAAAQNPPLTIDQFKELLEAQGGNFEATLADFREGMMLDEYVTNKFAGQIDVNDEEAKAFYDDNIEEFKQPELVQASHILLGHTDSADPNSDPNKVKAEDLLAQIRAGADFAELALANSIDQRSKTRGGDLGYFQRNQMVEPFSNAAFALEPNEVSDVVETQSGYHIIKVTDRQDAQTIPFDEVKDRIIEVLEQRKRSELVNGFIDELKKDATIEYPFGSEAVAPPAAPEFVNPAPITRTPRTSEPPDDPREIVVVEPNTN